MPPTERTAKPDHPWAVRGVSQEARQAATDAAHRDGMLLGPWLERAVFAAAAGREPARPQHSAANRQTGERLTFSKRELLLTGWGDYFAMPPGEQARFAYQRGKLETELRNQGKSPEIEAAAELQAAKAEADSLPSGTGLPPRRRRALAPGVG